MYTFDLLAEGGRQMKCTYAQSIARRPSFRASREHWPTTHFSGNDPVYCQESMCHELEAGEDLPMEGLGELEAAASVAFGRTYRRCL